MMENRVAGPRFQGWLIQWPNDVIHHLGTFHLSAPMPQHQLQPKVVGSSRGSYDSYQQQLGDIQPCLEPHGMKDCLVLHRSSRKTSSNSLVQTGLVMAIREPVTGKAEEWITTTGIDRGPGAQEFW